MNWSDGYVIDEPYTSGYFRKQSPMHLSVACALNGIEPVDPRQPFSCLELGAGQGLTANVLAASNPRGRFIAADFMPAHVCAARELAQEAGLDNVSFLENSFAELAAGKAEVEPLDFITLHGVYSWVNAENRRHIAAIIDRYLKPGGIVYVSYNALPGWAPAMPLQRLVLEQAKASPRPLDQQIKQARQLITGMLGAQAEYFLSNAESTLKSRLGSWINENPVYLAHEYMNQSWEALYHADVARDLQAAKLDFVASAELCMNIPPEQLSDAQRQLLDGFEDPLLRETAMDFLQNTAFRSDIFVRGARRMSTARRDQWWQQIGVALTVPRHAVTLGSSGEPGSIAQLAAPLLDTLQDGPMPLLELASRHDCEPQTVVNLVALLTRHNQGCVFLLNPHVVPAQGALRINDALASRAALDDAYQVLASPLLGGGITASRVERLVYGRLRATGGIADPDAFAASIGHLMTDQKAAVAEGQDPARAMPAGPAELRRQIDETLASWLPVWRRLRML
jgi:predicted O-methyltransferase YrrM